MTNAELNRFSSVQEETNTGLMFVLRFAETDTTMVSMNAMIGTLRMETDVTQLVILKLDGTVQEGVTQLEITVMKFAETLFG